MAEQCLLLKRMAREQEIMKLTVMGEVLTRYKEKTFNCEENDSLE